ncbi:ficolin-1-like isoform X2 [Drosophila obscura]|uniref:ficolin-1-like isoform X2 n=1 Tax=Drosophila obscura TaxID=7282 RepID=UPI001BB24227|nr:ficolin-1-like isoform X2 [Drosophila obscura]
MKSTWLYWLLVFFLCKKSTGLADFTSVVNELGNANGQNTSILDINDPSRCPIDHGIHTIQVVNLEPFEVFCDAKIAGPGWTVIARRTNGQLNFFRNWAEYKGGFGDIAGDFFIGLDKLHAITKSQNQELYVHLEDFVGNTRYAKYDEFHIESENDQYRMSALGRFTGDAGDSLRVSQNQKFTTYDRDNDQRVNGNCAAQQMCPWWHDSCTLSQPFGMYVDGNVENMKYKGIYWYHWGGYAYSFKAVQMLVRPK